MTASNGGAGRMCQRSRNRDKNLVTYWYECACIDLRVFWGPQKSAKCTDFKGLRSSVPLATFNRDKNLVTSPRVGSTGFRWVKWAVTPNREKHLASPQFGFALGRM